MLDGLKLPVPELRRGIADALSEQLERTLLERRRMHDERVVIALAKCCSCESLLASVRTPNRSDLAPGVETRPSTVGDRDRLRLILVQRSNRYANHKRR